MLGKAPSDATTIFLSHYPDEIHDTARWTVDIYCGGYTHGRQVALPFYGALVTLSRFDKQYGAGLHRVDQTWLFGNRGIGMKGGSTPRVRFCFGPEVPVIEFT